MHVELGDVAKIKFTTKSGEKQGKGLLIAKCGKGCLWVLVFWPAFSGTNENIYNTIRLFNPYKEHYQVGYSAIANGNVVSTDSDDILEPIGKVSEKKLEEAMTDVLDSDVAWKMNDFMAKEPRLVSNFYENYVGQYYVPGQTAKEGE